MKLAHIDENNKILGWYDSNIHSTIPSPTVEVSDEQWQSAIDSNHNKANVDGTTETFDFRTDEEKANYEANKYKELRRFEYPDIGDQLDALYHAGVFPEDMANKIKAVKDKYPKNSED